MRLAVLSDIHGNIHGLRAVLQDIQNRGADVVWCGGDLVGYGANPGEVVDLIQSRGLPTVMGNYDDGVGYFRFVCGCDYPDEAATARGLKSIEWTKQHTTDEQKAFLRSLPHRLQREIEGKQVVLVHASPAALNEYLFEPVAADVFRGHLASTGADVLIFGHTHKPFHKVLDGKHLINAGSAGKPKHGNPNATYVLVDISADGVGTEVVEVPYEYEAAARAIEGTDLPNEFAAALRAGHG
ncbi:MAG TPA: metallophosphoesterase family protein [Symbiobacteriaceae bacterium]